MNEDLRDDELDLLLLDGDPVDVLALRDIAAADGAHTLRAAIASTPARLAPRRRGRRGVVAVALAAAAAVAIPLTVSVLTPSSARPSAYAAPVVRFAQQAPRLLMSADGWRVADANQTYEDAGSMTFASGDRTIDIDWNTPAHSMDRTAGEVSDVRAVTIDGHSAHVAAAGDGRQNYFWAWWSVGDQGIQAAGRADDLATFAGLVTSLHHVDVTTWLDAMPRDEVTPAGRGAAVAAMLADIPVPPGFDATQLSTSTLLLDRYQLGARVTSAVGCGWAGVWFHGSAAERVEAAAAMRTSHRWAILREMAPEGGWSQSFWEVADFLNGTPTNNLVPGPSQTVEELVKNHVC